MSRQNFHNRIKKEEKQTLFFQQLLEILMEVRKEHPRLSARKIHKMLNIQGIGINKFEQFVSSSGLKVRKFRSAIITTRSLGFMYPNLTHGLHIRSINQLWSSDITYFITADQTYYIVLLIDVYSRRIIGYTASDNMKAVNNLQTLRMAFIIRKEKKYQNLIHHSDKGSQYGSIAYLELLNGAKIKISMAANSLENAYSERINGIIKNEYLIHMYITTLITLQAALKKVVKLYNETRPHMELGYLSPVKFEKKMMKISEKDRPEMILYDFRDL
ncbi:MAG: IS3 family transposase [Bacteroidales bacterium]|nr:IS3 family transposase [Bacteroidales bacterium]